MFIPSGEVFEEMHIEVVGLWWSKMHNNDSHLLIKMPTNVIKAIYNDVKVSIILSIWNYNSSYIMSYGMIIYDDLAHPFIVNQTVNKKEEYNELKKYLMKEKLQVHFFDEICRPIVSSTCHLDDTEKSVLKQFLENFKVDFNFNEQNKYDDNLHDLFKMDLDRTISKDRTKTNILERFFEINCKIEFKEPNKIYSTDGKAFILNDENEGAGLEQSVYQVLENVYYIENVYRSPQIKKKKVFRELTDILAWDDFHICLVESKVMSIFNKDKCRSSERFMLGIQKEIDKAISQLSGASKIINRDEVIFNQDKIEIKIKHKDKLDMHGIILLSEMYPFLRTDDLFNQLTEMQKKYNIKIHIMDLRELVSLVSIQGISRSIHLNLNIRWKAFLEQKSPFIRGEFPKIT